MSSQRSSRGHRLGFAVLALAASTALPVAAQDTYYVSSTAPSGPGSLPAAVAAMQVNGTTQTLRFLLPSNSVVTLDADLAQLTGTQVEVIGTDVPGLVIDGGGFRIFRYIGQSLLMRDVILRNGRSTGAGCLGSNATINTQVYDSQFLNCRTDGTLASGSSGGALFSFGSLRLTRTRFVGNQAYDGGVNNLGMGGGAVAVTGSPVLIENSEFIDNITVRTPMPAGNCADGVGAALVADLPAGGVAGLSGVSFTNNSHRCGTPAAPSRARAARSASSARRAGRAVLHHHRQLFRRQSRRQRRRHLRARGRALPEQHEFLRQRQLRRGRRVHGRRLRRQPAGA
jgi:hypothetical protein